MEGKEALERTDFDGNQNSNLSDLPEEVQTHEIGDTEKDGGVPSSFALLFEMMGRTTESTLNSINKKNKLDNVAIFVDYDNVYWTLMNNYSHDPNHEDQKKNLFHQLWRKYGQENVRTFRAYADFEKIKTQLTSLQKKRIQIRHVYSNGKDGDHRKNSSDIELCIDAIEHTYKDPNTTCYVFVTADSDMIPVISRMTYKSKQVELYYLSDSAPKHIDITSFANNSYNLLDFLNVEAKDYNIDDYVLDALKDIKDWHVAYKDSNLFLGARWLRDNYVSKYGITANVASQLIEKLKVEMLISEGTKKVADKIKPSLILTDKGTSLLKEISSQVAASKT
ncbi:NYN domain-containing protein [Paenibacillus sp. HB172176]|uniref:NYN domain-containing protein n=1 Tax=Paenibacillus sp. HB172176 TaxID=2493690 RepID=UPI001F10350F|nr:NYN domain-containing protein [Paenibacillus sp. HB172176]